MDEYECDYEWPDLNYNETRSCAYFIQESVAQQVMQTRENDMFTQMTAEVLGVGYMDVDKATRQRFKRIYLGSLYSS